MWDKAQKWELSWHDNCVNSYQEESKQIEYAKRMGLPVVGTLERYPVIDMGGKQIVDIGAGPYSLLLKCTNFKGVAVDPLMDKFPQWVRDRYTSAGIIPISSKGEDFEPHYKVDEVWIYNVLQHTDNPQKVIENARKIGKVVRIHDWLETPVSDGHIQTLKREDLDKWLGGKGYSAFEDWGGKRVEAYCGIFTGYV